jgi:TPR repeat protein
MAQEYSTPLALSRDERTSLERHLSLKLEGLSLSVQKPEPSPPKSDLLLKEIQASSFISLKRKRSPEQDLLLSCPPKKQSRKDPSILFPEEKEESLPDLKNKEGESGEGLYRKGLKILWGITEDKKGPLKGKFNQRKGAKWIKAAAEKTHPVAQCYLGILYTLGIGTSPCPKEGKKWVVAGLNRCFNLANTDEDAEASNALALLYASGIVVEKNKKEARKFFKSAILQKHPDAFYNLGKMYHEKKKLIKALEFYKKAAAWGHGEARYILKQLVSNLGANLKENASVLASHATER